MNALPNPIGVYAILDDGTLPIEVFPEAAADLARAGVRVVQLRIKGLPSGPMREWVLRVRHRCPDLCLILNDRPDIAALAGCDGVHLGDEDLPLPQAERVLRSLGSDAFLGASSHSVEEVRRAAATGIPIYLGAGPVFPSRTKPSGRPPLGLEGLRSLCEASPLPIVAIGGIGISDLPGIRRSGAAGAALISALLVPGQVESLARQAVEAFSDPEARP